MKAKTRRQSPWRHIVGTAEGGQEVIKRFLIEQIHNGNSRTPLVTIAFKDVVIAKR